MAVAGLHPGWIQRQQQAIIEFQNEQIKALLERQGKKRLLLTADQRRRLAVKGKAPGRYALSEISTKQNYLEALPQDKKCDKLCV